VAGSTGCRYSETGVPEAAARERFFRSGARACLCFFFLSLSLSLSLSFLHIYLLFTFSSLHARQWQLGLSVRLHSDVNNASIAGSAWRHCPAIMVSYEISFFCLSLGTRPRLMIQPSGLHLPIRIAIDDTFGLPSLAICTCQYCCLTQEQHFELSSDDDTFHLMLTPCFQTCSTHRHSIHSWHQCSRG